MFGSSAHIARRAAQALTLVLLTATAACEQATSPRSDTLDANAALADYRALDQMLASDGLKGVRGLSGRTPMSASSAVAAMQALSEVRRDDGARRYLIDLFRTAEQQSTRPIYGKTVISPRHLGRTLVYNPARDTYVIDSARTGAPANGTRFILYELDASGKPLVGREIGRADLLDEGANTGEAIALRLVVVTRNVTTLDYRTRVLLNATGGTISVTGFAADANERLDFTVSVEGRKVGTATLIDADFDLAVRGRNFTVTGTVRGVEEGRDGEGSIALTAKHQANTLRVTYMGKSGAISGGITWNGQPFVTISGTAANPILVGPTGQPLTTAEQLVVREVMQMADDVFDLVEELLEPVEDIVLLGFLL